MLPLRYQYAIPRPDGSLDRPSLEEVREIAGALGLDEAVPGRYSSLLAIQIFHWGLRDLGKPIGLVEEIAALDERRPGVMGFKSPDNAAPKRTFRGPLLKGLKHHHFFDPKTFEHLLENLIRCQVTPNGIYRFFDSERAHNNLTGDWLIYAQHEGHRYFLALGRHGDDRWIHEAIVSFCGDEFPFLRTLPFWPKQC